MLRGQGQLDGVRLLGPRTVEYMTRNHLPSSAALETFLRSEFAEPPFAGLGFGLGLAITLDPVAAKLRSSAGEYGWGGAASTTFWVDPAEDLTVLLLTQVLSSPLHAIRNDLKGLVSQAIVD
jgi:CubicO group peptidase (beta-lactamase class C family)